MPEQLLAIMIICLLCVAWRMLNKAGDNSDRIFFNILFPATIIGIFAGGVLQLF